jgi:hypothetical protein
MVSEKAIEQAIIVDQGLPSTAKIQMKKFKVSIFDF